eukprot:4553041-Pyramimonas_sp.AAC.1
MPFNGAVDSDGHLSSQHKSHEHDSGIVGVLYPECWTAFRPSRRLLRAQLPNPDGPMGVGGSREIPSTSAT